MSTTTTNYSLHKIDLSDAPPDITVLNNNWEIIDSELNALKHKQTECTGTGSAYVVTVTGIDSLTAGVSFMFTPSVVSSTASPTINVNGLGAKNIRRRISGSTSTTVATGGAGGATNWLSASKPVILTYDGNYWIADLLKPNMADVYGTLSIASGGTGATTVRDAANNFYETGTWTPKLICTGTNAVNPTYTLSNVVGYYCRIGKLVHIYCSMDTNIKAIGSGYAAVGGLPFAFYDGSALDLIQAYSCITTSSNDIHPIVHLGVSGSTYYAIFRAPSGAGAYNWKVHSGGNIKFSGVYRCG